CPHRHEKEGDREHEFYHNKKNNNFSKVKNNFKRFDYKKKGKRSFYTKEDDFLYDAISGVSYYESESDHEDVGNEVLFMTKDVMRSSSDGSSLLGDFIS
ncbi:hypothetical protein KI387_018269, partial [Taxus chinensis]